MTLSFLWVHTREGLGFQVRELRGYLQQSARVHQALEQSGRQRAHSAREEIEGDAADEERHPGSCHEARGHTRHAPPAESVEEHRREQHEKPCDQARPHSHVTHEGRVHGGAGVEHVQVTLPRNLQHVNQGSGLGSDGLIRV